MNREDLVLYLVALAVPLLLLSYGLWQVYLGYIQFGPAAMSAWGQPWFTSAALAVLPLFILTVRAVALARREVWVVDQGLVFQGMQKKTLAWKNLQGIAIEDVRYHLLNLTLRTRQRIHLFPTTGHPLPLDDRYRDLAGLGETIKARLYPLLLPELRKQFQANQWVYFGPLRINRKELDTGNRRLLWEQITGLRVYAGMVRIELADRSPLLVPAAKIPNVELLLQLVEELYTEQ
ncbi:MAG: hypothetical protein Fur0022_16730 [Anaerolineales bacterium]